MLISTGAGQFDIQSLVSRPPFLCTSLPEHRSPSNSDNEPDSGARRWRETHPLLGSGRWGEASIAAPFLDGRSGTLLRST